MMMNNKTFLYCNGNNDIEVRSTGRYTEKILPSSKKPFRKIEITPVDPDFKWIKFVDESELLEIKIDVSDILKDF